MGNSSTSPADFASRYRLYEGASPQAFEEGDCSVSLAADAVTVKPRGKAPIRLAFGEMARWAAADYAVRFVLRAGERVEIGALGRRYEELVLALKQMQRQHKLRALLLEETLSSGDWETGAYVRRSPTGQDLDQDECSIRIMDSSLAVLPENEPPFVVPYGEVDGFSFQSDLHGSVLSLGPQGKIALVRFARRTEAVRRAIEEGLSALEARRTRTLQDLVPDLGAFALRRLGVVLRDGVAVHRSVVDEAAPSAWDAIWRRAMVDPTRRGCAEELRERASNLYLAIKELGRIPCPSPAADGAEPQALSADKPLADEGDNAHQFLYFFAIGPALVLEVPSMTDSATYVFRGGDNALGRATDVSRALAAVQFRREPIYMTESDLLEGHGRRYLEAVRTLECLREVRGAFVGRALHTSREAWRAGLDEAISRL